MQEQYTLSEFDPEDIEKNKVIDYFPLTRIFVVYFTYTVSVLLTCGALAILLLLTTNLSSWVESLGDLESFLIQLSLETFNSKPNNNIGKIQAACFMGGIGSCTGANTVPNVYMPINPISS